MAMTLRLPPGLKAEADAHAALAGLSLNALVAVALRDYLDNRRRRTASFAARSGSAGPVARQLAESKPTLPEFKAMTVASRSDPCPCGSGKKYKHCHGALRS